MGKGNKEGKKSPPKSNPLSEALEESNITEAINREDREGKAKKENEEAVSEMKKSFDPIKVIKKSHIPEDTKEVWITEDEQVFFQEGFARKHGSKMKLKVTHVKI